jgi:hypothetical protein
MRRGHLAGHQQQPGLLSNAQAVARWQGWHEACHAVCFLPGRLSDGLHLLCNRCVCLVPSCHELWAGVARQGGVGYREQCGELLLRLRGYLVCC